MRDGGVNVVGSSRGLGAGALFGRQSGRLGLDSLGSTIQPTLRRNLSRMIEHGELYSMGSPAELSSSWSYDWMVRPIGVGAELLGPIQPGACAKPHEIVASVSGNLHPKLTLRYEYY